MAAKRQGESEALRIKYAKERNKLANLLRRARRKFEQSIASNCKNNPKAFWSHVRRKLKTMSGVAPLLEDKKDKNSIRFKDVDKANILQNQFSSVFTIEPDGDVPKLDDRTTARAPDIYVTIEMVTEEIKNLNQNKSCGPDNVHPRMLKDLVEFMAPSLTILLNKTFELGEIPSDWKTAYVSPIFKKGSKKLAENYRPISLTSVVCKLAESLIKKVLMKYLTDNQLISNKQYGFISGRSTVTQLMNYLDVCLRSISAGNVVDCIYLDFAKAFDSVPHKRLLGKLKSYGVSSNIYGWVKAFLTDRTQIVRVNGEESVSAHVTSGIPQGSVLGPILFIVYINDLLEGVNSDGLLFADDAKIFKTIINQKDSDVLQEDLDSLIDWSKQWLLDFNADKCHVLTLGKLENIKHTHRYSIGEFKLEHVFDEKDLGVTIDMDLTFEDHIINKVNKANSIMGLIRRSFTYLDKHLFKKLFTTFVRPHLEYAQSVWSPHLVKHIKTIENVQKRATKLVDGLQQMSYSQRLEILDLPTLVYRRRRGDMIEMFKHFKAYDTSSLCTAFQPRSRPSRKHGYQLHLLVPKDGSRGPQSNSFYYRVPKFWNDLPSHVVESKSIDEFKSHLDKYWTNQPFKFDYQDRFIEVGS